MLKHEVNSLETQKRNLSNQVTVEANDLEHCRVQCQKEIAKFNDLKERRLKMEDLVRQFETNKAEYITIKKTVEEKVRATLSDGKQLLYLALFCIIETIKENPDKYSPLFYENIPVMASHYISKYAHYPYSQEQPRPSYFDTKAILAQEAEKLYNLMAKNLLDEILNGYTVSSTSASTSLSLLPDEDSHPN